VGDGEGSRPGDGPEGGREVTERLLDLEPRAGEHLGGPTGGLLLLEGGLGVVVDGAAQSDELVHPALQLLAGRRLGRLGVHGPYSITATTSPPPTESPAATRT